ncbi:MAG: conserved rane protein of unknown function [Verrucomicrobiales bacterium]|jgi:hypothetical protein|nr:conserved rane protein of unknown function [Verrucomicrobiales bacterium]
MNRTRFNVIVGMILAAAASRFIPHPFNFSPIGAIALFSGTQLLDKRAAFLVPLAAMLIADFISGFHVLIPFVYACFALSVCIGFWVRQKRSVARITTGAVIGSLIFFTITNFGVWLLLGTYPHSSSGLMACYLAGIPYFQNTVLSDLFYSGVLFGGFAIAEHYSEHLREVRPLARAGLS